MTKPRENKARAAFVTTRERKAAKRGGPMDRQLSPAVLAIVEHYAPDADLDRIAQAAARWRMDQEAAQAELSAKDQRAQAQATAAALRLVCERMETLDATVEAHADAAWWPCNANHDRLPLVVAFGRMAPTLQVMARMFDRAADAVPKSGGRPPEYARAMLLRRLTAAMPASLKPAQARRAAVQIAVALDAKLDAFDDGKQRRATKLPGGQK